MKETRMAEPRIPDRSEEPALQESLDHGPKSTTATNSDEQAETAPPEAPPDAEEVEEMTGIPADSKELSTI
jgi:hypothetical protein